MRSWPRAVLISAVRGYRFFLSPWLGSACRFEPTCSVYALEALDRHGAAAGLALTLVPAAPPRLFTALLGHARGATATRTSSDPTT